MNSLSIILQFYIYQGGTGMRRIMVLLAIVFIASCAQVPKEASYPMTYQERMQASEHWRFLAKDISMQVISAVCPEIIDTPTGSGPNLSPEFYQKSPIQGFHSTCQVRDAFFISNADPSPFGQAMKTFLKTELISKGLTISSNPNCPFELKWDVQPVVHKAERVSGHSGIFVGFGEILRSLVAGDMGNDHCTKPHTEMIITYELNKREKEVKREILRGTRIYYVNDEDGDHYEVPRSRLTPIRYDVTNR